MPNPSMTYRETPFVVVEASFRVEAVTESTVLTTHLQDAFARWVALKGARRLPAWSTACFLEFPPLLLPWAVLATVEPEGRDYLIRFWGSGQSDLQKRDYTGKYVSEILPYVMAKKCLGEYDAVTDLGRPLKTITHGRMSTYDSLNFYKLRLPFGNEQGAVTHILSLEQPSATMRRGATNDPNAFAEYSGQQAWSA